MKNKFLAVIFLCFSLVCCATAPAPRQIQNSFPIDRPFDLVWQATIETFSDLNLPIMNMEKASGLITTDWLSANATYCDCGSPGFTIATKEYRGRFNVYVKKISENSCEVKINCLYEMIVNYSSGPLKYPCVSTGKLEALIYKKITEKIK
jgi:hypothetical protein